MQYSVTAPVVRYADYQLLQNMFWFAVQSPVTCKFIAGKAF